MSMVGDKKQIILCCFRITNNCIPLFHWKFRCSQSKFSVWLILKDVIKYSHAEKTWRKWVIFKISSKFLAYGDAYHPELNNKNKSYDEEWIKQVASAESRWLVWIGMQNLWSSPFRAGSLKRSCVGWPEYAASVHRGCLTSNRKASMKTETAREFHREPGMVRSR